jgi:hypothetical protein
MYVLWTKDRQTAPRGSDTRVDYVTVVDHLSTTKSPSHAQCEDPLCSAVDDCPSISNKS